MSLHNNHDTFWLSYFRRQHIKLGLSVILLEMEGTCYKWLKHFHALLISLELGLLRLSKFAMFCVWDCCSIFIKLQESFDFDLGSSLNNNVYIYVRMVLLH